MRIESAPICEPNQFIPPVGEPTQPIPAEFAFTPKQRQWYLRVYRNEYGLPQCAFPMYDDRVGFYRCQYTHPSGQGLEIHHITPSAWIVEQMPGFDPNSQEATLGIALCRQHHDGEIHPDMALAITNYFINKNGIKEAVGEHHELSQEGIIFWNNQYDEWLQKIARENIANYVRNFPNDPYPIDVSWDKKPHGKKWWQHI